MQTLAQKYPDVHANLNDAGFTAIAHMMSAFTRAVDLDGALGLNGATSNWCRGANPPSLSVERKARRYVSERISGPQITPSVDPVPHKEPTPEPADPERTFLVVAAEGSAAKVQRVLDLMRCEVVEV